MAICNVRSLVESLGIGTRRTTAMLVVGTLKNGKPKTQNLAKLKSAVADPADVPDALIAEELKASFRGEKIVRGAAAIQHTDTLTSEEAALLYSEALKIGETDDNDDHPHVDNGNRIAGALEGLAR